MHKPLNGIPLFIARVVWLILGWSIWLPLIVLLATGAALCGKGFDLLQLAAKFLNAITGLKSLAFFRR